MRGTKSIAGSFPVLAGTQMPLWAICCKIGSSYSFDSHLACGKILIRFFVEYEYSVVRIPVNLEGSQVRGMLVHEFRYMPYSSVSDMHKQEGFGGCGAPMRLQLTALLSNSFLECLLAFAQVARNSKSD
jgi:hypothetical protein